MKKYQIIEIRWLDSLATTGWSSESEVQTSKKRMVHRTSGYFLREDKQSIIVIQSYQEVGTKRQVHAVMEIPKSAIIKIRELK